MPINHTKLNYSVYSPDYIFKLLDFDKNHIVEYSQGEQNIISFKVKTQKFVDFMYEQNLEKIDLLKVDIEGAEYMMFDAIDDEAPF